LRAMLGRTRGQRQVSGPTGAKDAGHGTDKSSPDCPQVPCRLENPHPFMALDLPELPACVGARWQPSGGIRVGTKRPQNGVYEADCVYKVRPNPGDRDRFRGHWGRRIPDPARINLRQTALRYPVDRRGPDPLVALHLTQLLACLGTSRPPGRGIGLVTKRLQNGVYKADFACNVGPNPGDRDRFSSPLGPKDAGHRHG
jgi:hypothetical protein